jgi:localization factor PodJL
VKIDLGRAAAWYQRAAEQGNVKAMHNLAVLSASRDQSKPDYASAAKWFSAAAAYGLTDSQYNLAVLFDSGLGVGRDLRASYKWFSVAAGSGDLEAAKRRDAMKTRVEPRVMAEVESEVASWRALPIDPIANDARAAGEMWKRRAAASESASVQ